MASHAGCNHPATPAARAACRKQRSQGTAPLVITAPTHTYTKGRLRDVRPLGPIDIDTRGEHMTEAQVVHFARQLLDTHGLEGWAVRLDNAKRRAGQCRYNTREVSFSRHLLALRTYDETHNTISHEVAHALAGHAAGHGPVWQAKHIELGGDGKRCFDTSDKIAAAAPWIGTCEHGKQFPRHRAPKRLEGWNCRCPEGKSPVTWKKN